MSSQGGQCVHGWGDQQGICIVGLSCVDGLSASLSQSGLQLLGGTRVAHYNSTDGAESTSCGDQLEGGVLQLTLDMVYQNQNVGHEVYLSYFECVLGGELA